MATVTQPSVPEGFRDDDDDDDGDDDADFSTY